MFYHRITPSEARSDYTDNNNTLVYWTQFFSSLFLHKERDKPDTGKGSLHYF